MSTETPAPPPAAQLADPDALARAHDARTLARALAARLVADGRAELAAVVASMLDELAAIDPNPPNPHRTSAT